MEFLPDRQFRLKLDLSFPIKQFKVFFCFKQNEVEFIYIIIDSRRDFYLINRRPELQVTYIKQK
jgi:hypothetical protein